jgi:small-conductance mechanosensitive channel
MNDWLQQHHALIWWLVGVSAATFAATLVAVPVFVVRLPADYFATNRKAPRRDRHPVVHLAIAIVRNVVGYVFIVVGVAMLILPGQGILTILAGLGLVDFPGKHRLMQLIVKRKPVRKSLDWIRERGGKPKFQLDPAE